MPNSYDIRTVPEAQREKYWTPPGGALGELLRRAYDRAAALQPRRAELERRAAAAPDRASFAAALERGDVAVIAEIKRASPSLGVIRGSIDAGSQARAYSEGGAAAISVLTEPERFGGALADLETASAAVAKPLLRKDFIVVEEQILEARVAGASAVLLIARALEPDRLLRLARFAIDARVEPLVEVRTSGELAAALSTGARLIGINARDLETLVVQPEVVPALLRQVADDVMAIAESGIRGRADVERLAAEGADAVLVGAAISAADDPAHAVRALTGVPRSVRAARH